MQQTLLEQKKALRQTVRARRRQVSAADRQAAGVAIATHIQQMPAFHAAEHIAVFLAMPEEVDTTPVIETLWHHQKRCYLPIVLSTHPPALSFVAFEKETPLVPNQYGILEPASNHAIATHALDLILMPLVAFDRQGHRLGMGKGFYDHALEKLVTRPTLIGLAYECQAVSSVPHDNKDVKLSAVITESKIYRL